MAQNEIERKLNERLKLLPITEEETVVYVLTQVRKLMEYDTEARREQARTLGQPVAPSQYPTLGFYCNWPLHTSLDRNPAAQDFLNAVMPILTLNGVFEEAEHRQLESLLTLKSFRDELRGFLVARNISDTVCQDEDPWGKFLDAYSHVVHDAKIVLKSNAPPSGPVNLAVENVTIEAVPGAGLTSNRLFPMNWMIAYTDGRRARLEFSEYGLLGATVTFL